MAAARKTGYAHTEGRKEYLARLFAAGKHTKQMTAFVNYGGKNCQHGGVCSVEHQSNANGKKEEKADAEKSFKLDMISNGLNIDDKTSSLY